VALYTLTVNCERVITVEVAVNVGPGDANAYLQYKY
jgi:hypothetical protein